MFRRIILNIHIYGALLVSSYLLIYGFSSLVFNHPGLRPAQTGQEVVKWEFAGALPEFDVITDKTPREERDSIIRDNGQKVRETLGLIGWAIPWESQWRKAPFKAVIGRPGKKYVVEVDVAGRKLNVTETRMGPRPVIQQLHGLMQLPSSAFVSTWQYYTDLCNIVLVFASISGIYLWTQRRKERWIGLGVLGIATIVSLGLMVYITIHG